MAAVEGYNYSGHRSKDDIERWSDSGAEMTPEEEARLWAVSEHLIRHSTKREIRDGLGIGLKTIDAVVARLRLEWRARHQRNMDEHVAEELARLDHLEKTYWEAWERSIGTVEVKRTKIVPISKKGRDGKDITLPSIVETGVESREQVGEARFLAGVLACIDRRIKLLGLDAPDRIELEQREMVRPRIKEVEELHVADRIVARYPALVALAIGGSPEEAEAPRGTDHRQPVDSERSAREASGVLDVDGRYRE